MKGTLQIQNKIICSDLKMVVQGKKILKGISLQAEQGKVVALLGPNGAGKTTAFSILCGMIKPTSGKIYFNSRDITDLPMYKRARLGIGYLPQESSIFRGLTVEENIYAVLGKQEKSQVTHLLEKMSLDHIKNLPAVSVSGGERRKLEIARALVNNPKFILLDEPLAGIDPIAIQDMQKMITSMKNNGIGIIITDHNVHSTLSMIDYAYVLFEGTILAEGTAEEIVSNHIVQKSYLGGTVH